MARSKSKSKRSQRIERRIRERAQEEAAVPLPPDPYESENAHYPCPADGETLFGWTSAKSWDRSEETFLDHCEACGMAVTRAAAPPDVPAELAALERDGDELVIPNRGSVCAWLGAASWSELEPEDHRLHLTEKAARELLSANGTEVLASRTPFSGRGYGAMLQTMINAFTLRTNFARHARNGELEAHSTTDRLTFALDGVVTFLVAIPLSVVALGAELLAAALGRGTFLRLRTAPVAANDSSRDLSAAD
jgi:hypothetical protein